MLQVSVWMVQKIAGDGHMVKVIISGFSDLAIITAKDGRIGIRQQNRGVRRDDKLCVLVDHHFEHREK